MDAYGSSTVQNDLATFNSTFGLPSASLSIAYPSGKPKGRNSGWALETALDVEWAHALAPSASILLVVAKSSSFSDLMAAVDYAKTQPGVRVVSMSWGGSEWSGELSQDSHFSQTGVVFTAASGDNGTQIWPAASGKVLAVGGTTLTNNSNGTWSETAWSGSGGGISTYESEPGYQTSYPSMLSTNGMRGVPDISFDADPNTGVYVVSGGSWYQVGGTSLGSPSWAALIALADQGRTSALGDANTPLYGLAQTSYTSDYRDVTTGSNTGYSAGTNYDFVTGLGSPLANTLVPALAASTP